MKLVLILAVLSVLALVSCHPMHEQMMGMLSDKAPKEQFKLWHLFYRRPYDLNSQTALNKYKAFKENLKYIESRNSEQDEVVLGLGPFSDLSFEEFKLTYPGTTDLPNEAKFQELKKGKVPRSTVTENLFDLLADEDDVKDQRNLQADKDWSYLFPSVFNKNGCNADGIFAGVRTIEAFWKLQGNDYVELSSQQIIDCEESSLGCFGGFPDKVFFYTLEWGLAAAKDYKYIAKPQKCTVDCEKDYKPVISIDLWDYCMIDSHYPDQLCNKAKINKFTSRGPYASVFTHQDKDFQNYKSGILSYNCWSPQHGATVTQATDEYVKVLLSYGSTFGEKGYARFKRGTQSSAVVSCYLESYAFQPNKIYRGDEPDDEDE